MSLTGAPANIVGVKVPGRAPVLVGVVTAPNAPDCCFCSVGVFGVDVVGVFVSVVGGVVVSVVVGGTAGGSTGGTTTAGGGVTSGG